MPRTDRSEHRIGVLFGDGIGPEVVPCAVAAAEAAAACERVHLNWVSLPLGREALTQHATAVPESTLTALAGLDVWLLGPHDSSGYPPEFAHQPTPGAVIRGRFDLFANLRPCRAYSGIPATTPNMDAVIVRENSEGLYADRNMAVGSGEFMPTPDVALAVGKITRAATERIAHEAFRLAQQRSRRLVIVHKANVLKLSMGLFRDVCRAVAADYPDVAVTEQHVDAMAALLVRRPADFDVIVTENLFGDILSDLAAELSGSLGLAGSVNCSDAQAMAQATHGAAPDIAGRGIANPAAIVASTALALRWWGSSGKGDPSLINCADRIDAAIAATLAAGVATPDVGGQASTAEVSAEICRHIAED